MKKILKIQPIITTGYRKIKDGSKYDKYFPKVEMNDKMVVGNRTAEVEDVVKLMQKVVWKYKSDTQEIAELLKADDLKQTVVNIWNFLYHHIQYKLDIPNLEELRRPARLWHDKVGDCDDFAITASSILTNLQIPNAFRITKYDKEFFQHVYVIVPHSNGHYVIDPVLSLANYEKPFTEKKDFNMNLEGINVAILEGFGDADENDLINDLIYNDGIEGLGEISDNEDLEQTYNYLLKTRQFVIDNPGNISVVEDPQGFLKMLDYAIKYWHTPKRDEALKILIQNEQLLNQKNGFSQLSGDEDIYENQVVDIDWDELDGLSNEEIEQYLSKIEQEQDIAEQEFDAVDGLGAFWHKKSKRKKLREARKKRRSTRKTKRKAKHKAKKTKRKKIFRKFFKSVGNGLKKGFKAIVKYNPLVITARNGFLLSLKLNMFKFAERLKWGYATNSQIKGKISADYHNRAKKTLADVEKVFADKLQGKRKSLKKAILNGKSGGLHGIPDNYFNDRFNEGGVGAIASGTLVAAASAIIGFVAKLFKKHGLNKKGDLEPDEILSKLKKGKSNGSNDEEFSFDENGDIMPNAQANNGNEPNKIAKIIKDNPVKVLIGGIGILGLGAWGISEIVKSKKTKALPPSKPISGLSGKKNKEKTPALKVEKLM